MAERVVVPLEPGDVDETDGAPASALLEREKRLELLGEAAEVHQLGLGIAPRLFREIGHELLEVLRNAADGRFLGVQLVLDAGHLGSEACRQRLDRVVFGFLPQTLVPDEDRVECREQVLLPDELAGSGACAPTPQARCGIAVELRVLHVVSHHGSLEPATNGVPDQPGQGKPAHPHWSRLGHTGPYVGPSYRLDTTWKKRPRAAVRRGRSDRS